MDGYHTCPRFELQSLCVHLGGRWRHMVEAGDIDQSRQRLHAAVYQVLFRPHAADRFFVYRRASAGKWLSVTTLYHMFYQDGGVLPDGRHVFEELRGSLPIQQDSGRAGARSFFLHLQRRAPIETRTNGSRGGVAMVLGDMARATNGRPVCVFSVLRRRVMGARVGMTTAFTIIMRGGRAKSSSSGSSRKATALRGGGGFLQAASAFTIRTIRVVVHISSDAADPFNLGETTGCPVALAGTV